MPAWRLTALLSWVWGQRVGLTAETCQDVYKTAFKGQSSVKPAAVGDLYFKYCKKNMRVSSAKSMDELCKPLVTKAENKMLWVPPDTEVTPEIACKSVDALKQDYPEHAAEFQSRSDAKATAAEEERKVREALSSKAKELSKLAGDDLEAIMREAAKELSEKVRSRLEATIAGALGADAQGERSTKIVTTILETLELGHRGLLTKVSQKKDEAVGTWLQQEAKAKREAGATRAEL
mmetsp:Transcript_73067/g.190639  ORF Transcript_73067/g.190639 Transcript_73067/m.190639 type:complete len:235 (-) Transcript_73067:47-751(-)